MNLYVEHDAGVIARLAGQPQPACDGLIVRHGNPSDVLASTIWSNPFSRDWLLDVDLPGLHIVAWSGTLAEELFEPHPANWMRQGRERLDALCDELAPQLERHGRTLCFQPHSRHMLSDVPSCLDFLKRHEGQPFEISLSSAALLEPGMINDAEDHLRRIFEALAPRSAMLMLHDIVVDGDNLPPVALGGGVLPRKAVLQLIRQFMPAQTPIVINVNSLSTHHDWLAADM